MLIQLNINLFLLNFINNVLSLYTLFNLRKLLLMFY